MTIYNKKTVELTQKGHDLQDKVYIRRGQLSIVLPAATVVAAEPRNNIHVTSNETIVHVRLARIAGRHFCKAY